MDRTWKDHMDGLPFLLKKLMQQPLAASCKPRSPRVPLSVGLKQMVALPPETFLAEVRL